MIEKKFTRKKLHEMITKWETTMPERLSVWLKKLPKPLQIKLDFSLESIMDLQNYLWENYETISIAEDPKNHSDIECAGYYYGELFKKHMPMTLHWNIGKNVTMDKPFPLSLKNDEYSNASDEIFRQLLASLTEHNRDESHLNWYFNKRKQVFNRMIENNEYVSDFSLAIRLDDNYQFFLLHKTDTNPLPQIKTLLEDYFSTRDNRPKLSYYRGSEDYLIVEMSDEYCFHFKFKQGDRVKALIQEIAEKKYSGELDKKDIAQCQSTTEFWGDQDNNMDYINESLWLLEYLSSKLPDLVSIVDLKNDGEIFP